MTVCRVRQLVRLIRIPQAAASFAASANSRDSPRVTDPSRSVNKGCHPSCRLFAGSTNPYEDVPLANTCRLFKWAYISESLSLGVWIPTVLGDAVNAMVSMFRLSTSIDRS